jgi:hypothetical protein
MEPWNTVQEARDERLARIRIFDRNNVQDRFCAHIEILGLGAATREELLGALERYEDLVSMGTLCASLRPGLRFSAFPDSLVLVSDKSREVLLITQMVQWTAHGTGCMVRGGVAFGPHAEGEKAGARLIVSSALAKATALGKAVKRLCVTLHPEITFPDEWWLLDESPVLFFDGLRIVSPFYRILAASGMKGASQFLHRNPEYSEEYNWLLELYNAFKAHRTKIPADVFERLSEKYATFPFGVNHPGG